MTKSTHRQPLSVTLLACMVFIVSILNFLRLGLTLYNWELLSELFSSEGAYPLFPTYLAVSGLAWGLVGLSLIWGMWKGKSWAPRFLLAALLAYSIYYWIDRLFIPSYPQRNSNWPFVLSMNLLILLWSLLVLTRKRVRGFFGDTHER